MVARAQKQNGGLSPAVLFRLMAGSRLASRPVMLRSVAKQRVSKHGTFASFETPRCARLLRMTVHPRYPKKLRSFLDRLGCFTLGSSPIKPGTGARAPASSVIRDAPRRMLHPRVIPDQVGDRRPRAWLLSYRGSSAASESATDA